MPAGSRVMRSKDCSNARSASVFGRLVQNRSFLTVVEKGSLHRAAARLRISQPALSRQIQALEHESGGRFLERMATGVSPAAGGQTFAKRMGAVLAPPDLAVNDTRRALRGETSSANCVRPLSPAIPWETVKGGPSKSSANGLEAHGLPELSGKRVEQQCCA